MAVDDEKIIIAEVAFDGDWPKAAAIDIALNYGLLAIEVHRNTIMAQVSGHRAIKSHDFTRTTSIFLGVLQQHGYTIVSRDELNEILSKIESAADRITDLKRYREDSDRVIAGLEERIRERDDEIQNLSEELERMGKEPEQPADEDSIQSSLPIMKATDRILRCDGQHPYRRDEKGLLHPCVLSAGHGTRHRDSDGNEWWDDQGVNSSGVNRGQ